MDLELLAAAASSRAVAELVVRNQEYEDEESSNRATTPAVDGLDSNRGSLVEEEMEDAELELLPAGHFHPIGCPAPAPRASTPLLRPAAATPHNSSLPIAMARLAPDYSCLARPPVPVVMASHPSTELQPPQPSPPSQPSLLSQPAQPSQPSELFAPVQPINLAIAVGAPPSPFPPLGYAPSFPAPRPVLAAAPPAPAPLPLLHGKSGCRGGGTASGTLRCLGQMLSADHSHCDPQFVPVRIGNSSRFEHKFCHHCRARGIPVDPSRVRLLNPAYEDAVCASVGAQGNQHKRFWCHSPAVPVRFHLFNDKARCTGPKLVVLEAAVEGETDALLPVPTPKPTGGGMMDVDEGLGKCVRLWISYGTLTLQKSRKGSARLQIRRHRPGTLLPTRAHFSYFSLLFPSPVLTSALSFGVSCVSFSAGRPPNSTRALQRSVVKRRAPLHRGQTKAREGGEADGGVARARAVMP